MEDLPYNTKEKMAQGVEEDLSGKTGNPKQ